jgi:hypothetical protein
MMTHTEGCCQSGSIERSVSRALGPWRTRLLGAVGRKSPIAGFFAAFGSAGAVSLVACRTAAAFSPQELFERLWRQVSELCCGEGETCGQMRGSG